MAHARMGAGPLGSRPTRVPFAPAACLLPILALAVQPLAAFDCATITDEEARSCCERSRPETSMTQTLRAAVVDDSGTVREVGAELAWKRLPDDRIGTRVDVTAPPGDAGTIVLLVHRESEQGEASKRPQAYLYNPGERRDRLIAVDALAGELLGTDFSYEDFAFIHGVRSDLAVTRLDDEVYEGQEVIVLEAVPNDLDAARNDGMRYTRLVTRFDRERCVALHTRFYERGDQPRKELVADLADIREADGRWLPYRLTMHDRESTTHTIITVDKIDFDTKISDFRFARSALKRGR